MCAFDREQNPTDLLMPLLKILFLTFSFDKIRVLSLSFSSVVAALLLYSYVEVLNDVWKTIRICN